MYNKPPPKKPNNQNPRPQKTSSIPQAHPSVYVNLQRDAVQRQQQQQQQQPQSRTSYPTGSHSGFNSLIAPPPSPPPQPTNIPLPEIEEAEKPKPPPEPPVPPAFLKKVPVLADLWVKMILGFRAIGAWFKGKQFKGWMAAIADGFKRFLRIFPKIWAAIALFFSNLVQHIQKLITQISQSNNSKQSPSDAAKPSMLQQMKGFGEQMKKKISGMAEERQRRSIVAELQKKGVSFAQKLDSEKYGLEVIEQIIITGQAQNLLANDPHLIPDNLRQSPTAALKLVANKQVIPVQYPQIEIEGLTAQLRTLGLIIAAQQKSTHPDDTIISFTNIAAANLTDIEELKALIAELKRLWKLHPNTDLTGLSRIALNYMGQGLLSKDTYDSIMLGFGQFGEWQRKQNPEPSKYGRFG
jgi:hypothetical protein